jgi:hypothetical protein
MVTAGVDFRLSPTEDIIGDLRVCQHLGLDFSTIKALANTSLNGRIGDCRGGGRGPTQGLILPLRLSTHTSTIRLEIDPCLSLEYAFEAGDGKASNSLAACLISSREYPTKRASTINVGDDMSVPDSD